MNSKSITQIASIDVTTSDVCIIIRALERITEPTSEASPLLREFKELYKNMTGKNYGER